MCRPRIYVLYTAHPYIIYTLVYPPFFFFLLVDFGRRQFIDTRQKQKSKAEKKNPEMEEKIRSKGEKAKRSHKNETENEGKLPVEPGLEGW